MQRIWQLLCWLVLLAASIPLPSAAVERLPTRIEKPQNDPGTVYGIAQDQQDFLWLATEYDGLQRFDGEKYLRFNPPAGLPAFSLSQVVTDQHNQLWLGTWGHGLWQLNAERSAWQQLTGALPASARIQTLFYDSQHQLWIGSTDGLFVLRAGASTPEPYPALAGSRIWQLAEQASGTIWVATSKGLYQLPQNQAATGQWFQAPHVTDAEIRAVTVTDHYLLVGRRNAIDLFDLSRGNLLHSAALSNSNMLLENGAGRWLVGSVDGLYQLELQGGVLQTELQLPALDIRQLFRDKRQNIWLASRNNGLFNQPAAALTPLQPPVDAYLSPQNKHRLGPPSQTRDARWQPLEQSLLQLTQGEWRQIRFAPQQQVSYVRDVVEFAGQTLVGTDQGLFRLDGQAAPAPFSVQSQVPQLNVERMAVSPDGALWLALWEQGVLRIDPSLPPPGQAPVATEQLPPSLAQDYIVDMASIAQQFWLLSRSGKLYQATQGALAPVWQPAATPTPGYFHCLLPQADAFWLCTDQGLLRLSKDLQQSELFGLQHGLPDIRVIGITRTATFIWVLTRNGVLAMRPDGTDIHLLSPRPGLNLQAVQRRGISSAGNDSVVIATNEGLQQLDISQMSKVPAGMQLHLVEFQLDQQLFASSAPNQMIRLSAGSHNLQLKFKLLSFQRDLRVNYFFRWQGQSDWTALGPDAVLTLSQLAPGPHQLQVMAQAGGQYVHASPILFEVPVPWWLQPLGILALSLAGLLLLYLIYRYRVTRLQQRAEQLDALVAQRTQELETANQQLQHLSHTDSLTGLMNRRALQFTAGLIQAQRSRQPAALTLVLLDIDHFKRINDEHGHDVGDEVLRQVAAYLRQRLRSQDLVARWGGEEFLLLMPNTAVAQAQSLSDELRLGIHTLTIAGLTLPLSATFGVSPVAQVDKIVTGAVALEQALKAADLALYQGKRQGRDQVVLAADPAI